jgi:hypothetical protein
VANHVDPPPAKALGHGFRFLLAAGVAFPRAIVAPDHEYFFAGFNMGDDFIYRFLDCGVHGASLPFVFLLSVDPGSRPC